MEPNDIAQWITVVGGAIVGLWAIFRKARAAQAEEDENARIAAEERRAVEAKATSAGIDQAVAGMMWLVDSLKDRIDQQDGKIEAQGRQIDAQDDKINCLENDHRYMTSYVDRLHDWVNQALRKIREFGDTGDLPNPPNIPDALKSKLSQPWNREH